MINIDRDDIVISSSSTDSNPAVITPLQNLNIDQINPQIEFSASNQNITNINEATCANGVCTLSWKPKPQAA